MTEIKPEDIPKSVCKEMEIVRQTSATNMVIKSNVRQIAESIGLDNLLSWLDNHTGRRGEAYVTLLETYPEKAKDVYVDFSKHPFTIEEFYAALGVRDDMIGTTDDHVSIMAHLENKFDSMSNEPVEESNLESGAHHVRGSEITLSTLSATLETVSEKVVDSENEKNVYCDIATDIESKPRQIFSTVYQSIEIENNKQNETNDSEPRKSMYKQVISSSPLPKEEQREGDESVVDAIDDMESMLELLAASSATAVGLVYLTVRLLSADDEQIDRPNE